MLVRLVHFKSLAKLFKHLPLSLAPFLHSWMPLSVIRVTDSSSVELSATVLVKLFESFVHQCKSTLVHFASHKAEKLVVVNCSVAVPVECCKQGSDVVVCNFKFLPKDCLGKFRKVQRAVAVFVYVSEDFLESEDRPGTPCEKLLTEGLDQLVRSEKICAKR